MLVNDTANDINEYMQTMTWHAFDMSFMIVRNNLTFEERWNGGNDISDSEFRVTEKHESTQGLLKDGQESFSKIYKLFFRRYMPKPH